MPKGYRLSRTGLPIAADGQESPSDGRDAPLEDYEEVSGGSVDLDNLNWGDMLQTGLQWVDDNSFWVTDGRPQNGGSDIPRLILDTSTAPSSLLRNNNNAIVSEFKIDPVGTLKTVKNGHQNGGLTIQGLEIKGTQGKIVELRGDRISIDGGGLDVRKDSRVRNSRSWNFGTDENIGFQFDASSGILKMRDYGSRNGASIAIFPEGGTPNFIAGTSIDGNQLLPDINGGVSESNLDFDPLNDVGNAVDAGNLTFDPVKESEANSRFSDERSSVVSINETGIAQSSKAARVGSRYVSANDTITVHQPGLVLSDGAGAPSGLDLIIVTGDEASGYTKRQNVVVGDGTVQNPKQSASWSNGTGSGVYATVAVDNGRFGSGTGSDENFETLGKIRVN